MCLGHEKETTEYAIELFYVGLVVFKEIAINRFLPLNLTPPRPFPKLPDRLLIIFPFMFVIFSTFSTGLLLYFFWSKKLSTLVYF